MENPFAVFKGIGFVAMLIGIMWLTPIYFGRRNFIRKGYSAHWMWFGIHPLTGYIALIVSACITARKECGNCGGTVAANFRICPHCGGKEFIQPGARRA